MNQRYKLTLEYDGSNFSGWQKQKNAKTIQATLIECFQKVLHETGGSFKDLQGAGRTDTGVHAYAQVAHLDAETDLQPQELMTAVNHILPPSINILSMQLADPRFHARHWAKSRQYVYRISKRRNAFERKFICWVKDDLNVSTMQTAAASLIGFADFASFSSKPAKEKSTQVDLHGIDISEHDDLILVRVKASHFLWNMVRNLVGALIEIGKGDMPPERLAEALQSYDAELCQFRAPAAGLFLEQIEY